MVQTPQTLRDRYRFEAPLGRGAQAKTYRAVRLEDQLPVVVKVLSVADVDDWKVLELFEREAKVLAGLDVDGVPALLDFVRADEEEVPALYIVQELIEGQSLAAMMEEGKRFTEEEVVNIGWQLLGILEALHALRPPVVHRDVKPGNVVVRPDGRCTLVDFGAVSAPPDVLERGAHDQPTVAGTFGYMAPEQLHGQASPASDLYGVGATMVHLLSGIPPSAMELENLRLRYAPHVEASPTLLHVIDKLIEPDVEARLASASEARAALEHLDEDTSSDEGALATVATLAELEALGQPGSMTLFHALEKPKRRVPAPYRRRFASRILLWTAGGALLSAVALSGALAIIGVGAIEGFFIAMMPFIAVYGLMRNGRRVKRLLRHGRKTTGKVSRVARGSESLRVHYSFIVAGKEVVGVVNLEADVVLEEGEPVGILYQPDTPEESMIYPVPVKAITKLFDE